MFLSKLVISEIFWGMAASPQHWRWCFFCLFFQRKEVDTHKLISLVVMPRMTLTSPHFFHKSLMKTNWRVRSSQLTFIKSCQDNGSASDGICFPGWPAWRGREKWWISVSLSANMSEVFWCCLQQSKLIHGVGEVTRRCKQCLILINRFIKYRNV